MSERQASPTSPRGPARRDDPNLLAERDWANPRKSLGLSVMLRIALFNNSCEDMDASPRRPLKNAVKNQNREMTRVI
jgi:hypothetical protein